MNMILLKLILYTGTILLYLSSAKAINQIDNKLKNSSNYEQQVAVPVAPNGYLLFCLCMGRFGNQMEHFLGGLGFAKKINRTLIIPPLRTYTNIEYDQWFDPSILSRCHPVILAKDFMSRLAPQIWPSHKRFGWCYDLGKEPCEIKKEKDVISRQFWDDLGVNFTDYIRHHIPSIQPESYALHYPADEYPVMVLGSAPASFPMKASHLPLQRHIQFSAQVIQEGKALLEKEFGRKGKEPAERDDYLGVHLRIGSDWEKACRRLEQEQLRHRPFMASYQCRGWDYNVPADATVCFPNKSTILQQIVHMIQSNKITKILVASDGSEESDSSYISELRLLISPKVHIGSPKPWLPVIDAYLLSNGKYFIGNCYSSFSAFVSRQRLLHGLGPSYFFGTKTTAEQQMTLPLRDEL